IGLDDQPFVVEYQHGVRGTCEHLEEQCRPARVRRHGRQDPAVGCAPDRGQRRRGRVLVRRRVVEAERDTVSALAVVAAAPNTTSTTPAITTDLNLVIPPSPSWRGCGGGR